MPYVAGCGSAVINQGVCTGALCGGYGTQSATAVGYDSACNYKTNAITQSCSGVTSLTSSATSTAANYFFGSQVEDTLTVSGCAYAPCSGSNCDCSSRNPWRAAVSWACAPLSPPSITAISSSISGTVWAPQFSASWTQYPLGWSDVQYTNGFTRPNYGDASWPTTSDTLYIFGPNGARYYWPSTQPTISCNQQSNAFPSGVLQYKQSCTVTGVSAPSNLSDIFGINLAATVSFGLGVITKSEATAATRTYTLAPYNFVYPAALPWTLQFPPQGSDGTYGGIVDGNHFLISPRNLQFQALPPANGGDFTVKQLVFQISCTSVADLLPGPVSPPVWPSTLSMPTGNGYGFYRTLTNAFGALPVPLWEAYCDVTGQAVNGNPDPTKSTPPSIRFGILKAAPLVVQEPYHMAQAGSITLYWTDATGLYTNWANCFKGNTAVPKALQQAYPTSPLWSQGDSTGIYSFKITTLLSLVSNTPGVYQRAVSSGIFPVASVGGPTNILLGVDRFLGSDDHQSTIRNPSLTAAMSQCRAVSALYHCVNCFQCQFSATVTAGDASGNTTSSTTSAVVFDVTAPVIQQFALPGDKAPLSGTVYYAQMTDMIFDTSIYEPEGPLASVALNMALADFALYANSIANIFGTLSLGPLVNAATGALHVNASTWNGKSFHNQRYTVQVQALSASGLQSQSSVDAIVDSTPPTYGYVRFNQTYYDPSVSSGITVTFGGFTDSQSGIKEFYYRVQADGNSICSGADFTYPTTAQSGWTLISLPSNADPYAPDAQTLQLSLSQIKASNFSVAVAAVNRAATFNAPTMTQSVTFACSVALLVDSVGPSIDIHSIVVEDSVLFNGQNFLAGVERTLTATWNATDTLSGISSYLVTLYLDGQLASGPSTWYTNEATLVYKNSGPVPQATQVKVCVSAVNYAHRVVGPVCQTTVANAVEPDFSTCSVSGMNQPTALSSSANVFLDWSKCVSTASTIDHYEYFVMTDGGNDYASTHQTLPANTTSLVIPLNTTVLSGKIAVCVSLVDLLANISPGFCTNQIIVDSTAPVATGGVRNLDPLSGLPIQATYQKVGLLVGWDIWRDVASSVSSYTISITSSAAPNATVAGPVTIPANAVSDAAGKYTYAFQNYALTPGTVYTALVYATSAAGISSMPLLSPGIQALDSTTIAPPLVSLLDGLINGPTHSRSYPYGEASTLHVAWQNFQAIGARSSSFYQVQFVPVGSNMTSPAPISVGQTLDALVQLPPAPGAYQVQVTFYLVDPSGSIQAAQSSSANEHLLLLGDVGFAAGAVGTCSVAFDATNSVNPLAAGYLQAIWSPFVDPYNLISRYQIAFRRIGDGYKTSQWADVPASASSIAFAGSVNYTFSWPNIIANWQVECQIRALDSSNRTAEQLVPAALSVTPQLSVSSPAVVSVVTDRLTQMPAGSTDYAFFENVPMITGSNFAVAFFGFPALQQFGVPLATVQYSVGTVLSSVTGTFDDLVSLTLLDLTGDAFPVRNYSILVGTSYMPVQLLQIPSVDMTIAPVYVCVNVTTLATSSSTVACSSGIGSDASLPLAGTVLIDNGASYGVASSSVNVSWSGFRYSSWLHPAGDGISFYEWGLGTYPGGDDVLPMQAVDSTHTTSFFLGQSLLNAESLYATVLAMADNGMFVNATSNALFIDFSPPVSILGIKSIVPSQNLNGNWTVEATYDQFEDVESGIASLTWAIETQYGYEDVLSSTTADTPVFAVATSLRLSVGLQYTVRVVAVNRAGLSQEIVGSFQLPMTTKVLSVSNTIGSFAAQSYSSQTNVYGFSWTTLGSPAYVEYAVGTEALQADVVAWTRAKAQDSATISLDELFMDGQTVYGSVRVFTSDDVLADEASSGGLTFDSTAPVVGRVIHGLGPVHDVFTTQTMTVSFNWIGFSDSESGIDSYYYCIDTNALSTQCTTGKWTVVYGHTAVRDATPVAELTAGVPYWIKIRAVNNAGLSSIGVSPAFQADPTPPQAGSVVIQHPGDARMPTWVNGVAYYQDFTTLQIGWAGFIDAESGISSYQVAVVEQESGKIVQAFTSAAGLSQWRFTDADGLHFSDAQTYYAVVLAADGAGLLTQATSKPFTVDTQPPMTGNVAFFFTSSSSISVTVDGFTDQTSGIAQYAVLIGTFPYGQDVLRTSISMQDKQECNPCRNLYSGLNLKDSQMYHVTVYAIDAGGLWSAAVVAGQLFYSSAVSLTTAVQGFSWNVTSAQPNAVDFSAPLPKPITVTGYGWTNFIAPTTGPTPMFTCQFAYPGAATPLTYQTPLVYSISQVSGLQYYTCHIQCQPPQHGPVDAGSTVALTVIAPDGTVANSVAIVQKPGINTWGSTSEKGSIGLSATVPTSAYRISRTTWQVSWPSTFPAASVAYFGVYAFNNQLAMAPGDATQLLLTIPASSLATFKSVSTVVFQICPYFYGDPVETLGQTDCLSTPAVSIDNNPVVINPQVSEGYESQIPTAVRIVGFGASQEFIYEAVQFQAEQTSLTAEWTDSFAYGSAIKQIDHYDIMVGYAPFDASASTPIFDLQTTSTNLSISLQPGIAYYVTVAAWDIAGIPTIAASAPITVDSTAPTGGRVYCGNFTSVLEEGFQSSASKVNAFWKDFVESESLIAEFRVCLWDGTKCVWGPTSTGLSNSINMALTTPMVVGTSYSVRVEARNGAGLWSAPAFSNSLQVDTTPPIAGSITFGSGGSVAQKDFASQSLTWTFTDNESPIVNYLVQLGSSVAGSQILPLTSTGKKSSLSLNGLRFDHNISVYGSVIAVNAAGLQSTKLFGPVAVDLTPPVVVGSVSAMSGQTFVASIGPAVPVTARWSFVDWESGVTLYQWALGTLQSPEAYTQFTSAGTSTTLPSGTTASLQENSTLIVTVKATNGAGLQTVATSQLVTFTVAPPSAFVVTLLDTQYNVLQPTSAYQNVTYVPSDTGIQLHLDGLSAGTTGIANVEVKLVTLSGSTVFNWTAIGVRNMITLASDMFPRATTMSVQVRVTNGLGLMTISSSTAFRIGDQPPIPGTVLLSWVKANGTTNSQTKVYSLQVTVTPFQDGNAPGYPVNHTLGVLSSDAISEFDVHGLSPLPAPDSSGRMPPVMVAVDQGLLGGRNFTAVVRGIGSLGLETTVVQMIQGPF
ncbi:hypothetical protein HDU90_006344 [Geranomyces variabilis]|nr:hypothetical protein HDU90_006344 [Geranomyces variabilis]